MGYTITAAIATQELDASGRLVDVMEATGVTTPNGAAFVVRTAKTPGWRDRIRELAAAEAAELESLFEE